MTYPFPAQAAHRMLVACGCNTVTHPDQPNLYYHNTLDLYLAYAHELPEGRILPDVGGEFIIIVPSGFMAAAAAANPDYPHEVITVEDIAEFLLYRAFGPECEEHRGLVAEGRSAYMAFDAATNACDEAEEAWQEVAQVRANSRPPRFQRQPVALAA